MADRRGRSTSPQRSNRQQQPLAYSDDDSILNSRQIEAFGRTVHATAAQLISSNHDEHYRSAISSVHRSLRRPMIQRSVFSFAKANPRELIRANFNTTEIDHRAQSYLPDELLRNVPPSRSPFSLLEGFKASLPEDDEADVRKKKRRHGSKGQKLLEEERGPPRLTGLKRERDKLDHRLEMMGVRKTMCASEIKEIDDKIANLNTMRKVILERLADLEQEEHDMEQEMGDLMEKIEITNEEIEDEEALAARSGTMGMDGSGLDVEKRDEDDEDEKMDEFMSQSIYQKLPKAGKEAPSPRSKRKRMPRRVSMPILHENMEPGSRIREFQAHNDIITAIDFDAPFGTMVSAALDDTVRVWDLNAGRCMGFLEGHLSSVRCLQVEDNIVATGSMDASIRLWDLSQADYNPQAAAQYSSTITSKPQESEEGDEATSTTTGEDIHTPPPEQDDSGLDIEPHANAMADCPLFTLQAHVAEITALNFRGSTLVSGSADKTIRQWDLEKGRCVQTLDVLWAAAQASSINNTNSSNTNANGGGEGSWWRPTQSRVPTAEADFVGALQVFDAALACGTADGMVRLWDLRSGTVHRSLVGHTGPVTALQFDDVFLVTGSRDRSIRVSYFMHSNVVVTPADLLHRYGISEPAPYTTLLLMIAL
jgi:mitochondrial division protein 1